MVPADIGGASAGVYYSAEPTGASGRYRAYRRCGAQNRLFGTRDTAFLVASGVEGCSIGVSGFFLSLPYFFPSSQKPIGVPYVHGPSYGMQMMSSHVDMGTRATWTQGSRGVLFFFAQRPHEPQPGARNPILSASPPCSQPQTQREIPYSIKTGCVCAYMRLENWQNQTCGKCVFAYLFIRWKQFAYNTHTHKRIYVYARIRASACVARIYYMLYFPPHPRSSEPFPEGVAVGPKKKGNQKRSPRKKNNLHNNKDQERFKG